jgi:hypothetical protein
VVNQSSPSRVLQKVAQKNLPTSRHQAPAHPNAGTAVSIEPTLQHGQVQRAIAQPSALTTRDVMALQRTIGNQAVQRLLNQNSSRTSTGNAATIQTKLTVGPAQDRYEREADQVAARVIKGDLKGGTSQVPGAKIQRLDINHKSHEPVQTKRGADVSGGVVEPQVEQGVTSARGGGRRLDESLQRDMEEQFGADFEGVRVHTDARADTLNRMLDARAFTTGQDIFFKRGEYQPKSQEGKQLLAHELTHVRQQTGAGTAAPIQRKSDKLPTKASLRQGGKSNKIRSLFGATTYTKILDAIDQYHGLGDTDYLGQLHKLVEIHSLLVKWQINHGETTGARNRTQAEKRDTVLHNVRTNFLPEETADVFAQAQAANVNVDVATLAQLLDIMQGKPDRKAQIEQAYAAKLRSFHATNQESSLSEQVSEGKGTFLGNVWKGGTGEQRNRFRGLQNMDVDPTGGLVGGLNTPISPTDGDNLKKYKREYAKNVGLKQALSGMSEIEFLAIAAYTDESGYGGMNRVLRGDKVLRGNTKQERQRYVKERTEIQHLNLMGSSGLNRLPDWDSSTVYRGEEISWAGNQIVAGRDIVLPSFTSTSASRATGEMIAGGVSGPESALWIIDNVTHQGKDISKLTVQQQKDAFGFGYTGTTEDEVLLKPYTRLRIVSKTQTTNGERYKWVIHARAL